MPVWEESDEVFLEAGFKVQIHDKGDPPFIHELGFGVSPGFQTLVATQEQRIKFLPEPFGDCLEKSNIPDDQRLFYDDYTISGCRITCETLYMQSQCGCRMVHMPGNGTICSPEVQVNCADIVLDWLTSKDKSVCVCKTPCDNTRYQLESSVLRLPSQRASEYLAYSWNRTTKYVQDNIVKLNVYFEELSYETIDQVEAYAIGQLQIKNEKL